MPRISVMIPVYNRATLIEATLDSVLAQTFRDYDVTIVDDASVDGTLEVLRKYESRSNVKILQNEKNLGLTRNWNRCLRLAKNSLTTIVQSDDLIDPDYLEIVSAVYDQHPDLGFVAASCRYIDADGRITDHGRPRPRKLYAAGDDAVTFLLQSGFPHVSSIVLRRAAYEKSGYYDERIWHGPDVEFDARLASRFDVFDLGSVHTSFRRHGSNRGNLEYLRSDFLAVNELKFRGAWGCLSPSCRARIGGGNLDQKMKELTGLTALTGAVAALGYGRQWDSLRYLQTAVRCAPSVVARAQFWKVFAAASTPWLGPRIAERRLQVRASDKAVLATTRDMLNRE